MVIQALKNVSDIIKSAFNSITTVQCKRWIKACGYQ